MFARFGTLLIIVISAVLAFSVTADAINVDSVGPESSYDNYIWAGSTQYSRAEFNEPFGIVYWYVKGSGETGLGTLVYTDYGDGTSESSQFSHTFSSGSTSGEVYEITAYVYPHSNAADQSVDWDSYTLTVWTPAEEVITTPDELTITDDIKIGDYYTFIAEASSTNSNYIIEEMEVFVDGVSVASQSFSADAIIAMSISGYLPISAGSEIEVALQLGGLVRWGSKKAAEEAAKKGAVIGGKWALKRLWQGRLAGGIVCFCVCKDDLKPLDSRRHHPYDCQEDSQLVQHERNNTTRVRWTTSNRSGIQKTDNNGKVHFENGVPYGHDVTMWIKSDHLHNHIGEMRICKYETNQWAGKIGEVILGVLPYNERTHIHHFGLSPLDTFDPCDGPYPDLNFTFDW